MHNGQSHNEVIYIVLELLYIVYYIVYYKCVVYIFHGIYTPFVLIIIPVCDYNMFTSLACIHVYI